MRVMLMLVREACRSLTAHKLRSALTMLGVIIGVGAVIVMLGIGEGARRQVSRNIQSLGTNLLIIRPGFDRRGPVRHGSVQTLTQEDARAIATQVPGVAAVSPESGGNAQVKYSSRNVQTSILGAAPSYPGVNNFQLAEGAFFSDEDLRARRKVAVLGATPLGELFAGEPALGKTIKIKGVAFRVVGVLAAKGQTGFRDPDDQILIPLDTAQRRIFGSDHLRSINVEVENEELMAAVQADIEVLLGQRHRLAPGAPPDFSIRNQKEILDTMSEVSDTFTTLLAAVAAVAMLIGGIGIMNIMLVSVTERTREIGVRKALGARRRDVLFQFLVEAVVLSLAGGLVGIAAGLGAAELVGSRSSWETAVGSESIVFSFAIALIIGIFFGLYPARKASRLDPIEALRYE